jgi:hypothetical protein
MTPHKEKNIIIQLLNCCITRNTKKGGLVVENAFGILKQMFKELFKNIELQ